MIPVPSYQVLEFAEWLHSHQIHVRPEELEREKLRNLARSFLREGRNMNLREAEPTLIYLLWVFQTCPMISENDIKHQFEHFVKCGHCIRYIDEMDSAKRNHRSFLHPLLSRFAEYIDRAELNERIKNLRSDRLNKLSGESEREMWLYEVLQKEGSTLYEYFARFIDESDQDLVKSFIEKRKKGHKEDISLDRSIEDDARPIDYNNIDHEADRLVHSLEQFARGDFYGRIRYEDPGFLKALRLVPGVPERLAQSLEFLEWLSDKHPELDIEGDIPSNKVKDLVYKFCSELEYDNKEDFYQTVQKWLRGEGPSNITVHLKRFIHSKRKYRKNRSSLGSIFERYKTVELHGIFLFLSSGDYPDFIDQYWKDLNALTSDFLDIYYNREELESRVSGYDILSEFQNLQIDFTSLPAFVLWRDSLSDARAIYLDNLDNDQVFEVVQHVVQGIKEGDNLTEITNQASELVSSYKIGPHQDSDRHNLIIIESGGAYKMVNEGDEYNVSGQAGAVGPDASAHDMDFKQIWNQVSKDSDLEELVSELKQLRSALEQEAETVEEKKALQKVTDAEHAAEKESGPATLQHLAKAGKWSLKVAEKIGTTVAATAIKAAMGM